MVKRTLRRWLPAPHTLSVRPGLRWLQPLLATPYLWRLDAHGVAVGAACGVFFGFLIPIGQIPLAGFLAYALRGNLPAAVVSTFVSNPLTYVPIYMAAYHVGGMLLNLIGFDIQQAHAVAGSFANASGLLKIGPPLALGLGFFAVVGSLSTYFAIQTLWRLLMVWRIVRVKRRIRRSRAARRS